MAKPVVRRCGLATSAAGTVTLVGKTAVEAVVALSDSEDMS
jgi:hypothetical protein